VELDVQELERCLRDFLDLVDSQPADKAIVGAHLRYPSASGTLAGSALGRQLWDSPEGSALISCLLEDERLREWFAPPPEHRLNELHFRVASLVDRWRKEDSSPNTTAILAREFAETLREPDVVATAVQVFFGLTADSLVVLPYDFRIAPATQEQLGALLSMAGGREVDVLRIPARSAVAAMVHVRIPRLQFGATAGITAVALPTAMFEGLRLVLWLATGIFCGKGDYYVSEESRFPIADFERHTASVGEMFSGGLSNPTARIDVPLVNEVMLRHEGGVKGRVDVQLPDDIGRPLWTASTFLDAALRSLDTLFVLFLCYSALEGMMLLEDDNDSRLGPRVARLIGRDVQERRNIRRTIEVWRRLRGSAAHGRRGDFPDLARFLGREREIDANSPELSDLDARQWEEAARIRALELARRTYLGMLYPLVRVEAETVTEGMTRSSVLQLLESAERNDASAIANLDAMIPMVVRSIEA